MSAASFPEGPVRESVPKVTAVRSGASARHAGLENQLSKGARKWKLISYTSLHSLTNITNAK